MSTSKRFIAKNGLDNGNNSITNMGAPGSSISLVGANALTLTTTGTTNVTLPTSGTLLTAIKITVIGDSLSSSNMSRSAHWVDILKDNLNHFGENVNITTLAVGGATYNIANTTIYYGTNTMVNECISTNPDIVIVMLGLNDISSGRTQLEIKADALATYTNLRAGLPTAKILYVSELFYDNINFTPTTVKNKGIIPTYFNLPSSGILINSYTSEALETVVASTTQTKVTNWVDLDTYVKGFSQVDAYCTYYHWKSARMGLFVLDGLHQNEEGSKLIAQDILVGLKNASFSTTLLPKLKQAPSAVQGTTNSIFTDVLTASGDGFITNYSTEHNYYSLESGPFRKYNLDTWYMPFKGNFYVTNTSITNDSFSDNVWIFHSMKPNTLIEKSINGGAFSTTGQSTNYSGYASLHVVGKDFGVGSHILRVRVGTEVYGPITITVTASIGTGTGSAVYATSPTLVSPTLVTPILGTPTSANFSTGTFTWPSVVTNSLSTITNAAGTTIATASANKLKVVGEGTTTVTGTGDTLTITSTGGGGNITLANLPAGTVLGQSFVWNPPTASWVIGGNMYSVFNSITPSSGTAVSTSNNTISVSGTAPITVTGSGSTLTIDMPVASGSVNGYLSSANWTTFNNKGTCTSVGISVPSFLSAGAAVTSSGTIAISYSGTPLPVANGGTGSTTSTGTGAVVRATTPTLVTPVLGTATATQINYTSTVYSVANSGYFAATGNVGCVLAVGGTTVVATESGVFRPAGNGTVALGSSTLRWSVVYAANGVIQTSDARLKTDITESSLGLDFINKLKPVSYKWIVGSNEIVKPTYEETLLAAKENRLIEPVYNPQPGKRTHYGLLAQQVHEALDGVDFGGYVDDPKSNTKSLRYEQFISPLIKAVQELTGMVTTLQKEVQELKETHVSK